MLPGFMLTMSTMDYEDSSNLRVIQQRVKDRPPLSTYPHFAQQNAGVNVIVYLRLKHKTLHILLHSKKFVNDMGQSSLINRLKENNNHNCSVGAFRVYEALGETG